MTEQESPDTEICNGCGEEFDKYDLERYGKQLICEDCLIEEDRRNPHEEMNQ